MMATLSTIRNEGRMNAAAVASAPLAPDQRYPTHITTCAASGPGIV